MSHSAHLLSKLQPILGRLESVKLTRRTPCEPVLSGYALSASDEWLLFWQFNEFWPDGFSLQRLDGIDAVRHGIFEAHWTKMLKAEGIATKLPSLEIELASLELIFRQLLNSETPVIVHCEDPDSDDEDVYIGKVIQVNHAACIFASFDGMGVWDDDLHSIELCEISRIQIETPYATLFSRHLNRDCPFDVDGNWLPVT